MSDIAQDSTEFRARYDAFIASLTLEEVRLSNAEIHAPRPFTPVVNGLEAAISTATGHTPAEKGFVAWMTLSFEGRRAEEQEPRIRIRATVEATYRVETPITDELFEVFSQRNLPLNTWPYLREFLQNALARSGWPVYTLPAFKPAAVQLQLQLPPGTRSAEGTGSS